MSNIGGTFDLKGQVTFLPTDDHQKSIDFYEGILGLTLVRDQGLCRIYRTGPSSYIGFCDHGYAIPSEFRVVITLLIDDVDGVFERLQRDGVATESMPCLSERFDVYQFFVRDPNGYLVEIQRFNDPLER
ncbi:MAG: VOC family protein [Trueperaceae bacterium]|nr:VOC family protein [Trueperaceae bacterium]